MLDWLPTRLLFCSSLLITVSIGVLLIVVVGESNVRNGQLTPLVVAFPFCYKSMFQMKKRGGREALFLYFDILI
jgi:hypothetical protein